MQIGKPEYVYAVQVDWWEGDTEFVKLLGVYFQWEEVLEKVNKGTDKEEFTVVRRARGTVGSQFIRFLGGKAESNRWEDV